MSLNDSLTAVERSKLAVWDYPVSDKYTKMWQAMLEAGLPNSLEEAVQRIRNSTSASGFAFLGDATDIRYQVLTNCDLQMVGEEFSRKPYAIAVQQGSPLKDQFNNAYVLISLFLFAFSNLHFSSLFSILMLLNRRELEKLKEQWWKNDDVQNKCEKPDDQSDGISIQNIGGVFIVIFVGIGMACITLLFEFWYYKYRNNSKVIDVAESTDQQHGGTIVKNVRPAGKLMKQDSLKDSTKGHNYQNLRTRTLMPNLSKFQPRF